MSQQCESAAQCQSARSPRVGRPRCRRGDCGGSVDVAGVETAGPSVVSVEPLLAAARFIEPL